MSKIIRKIIKNSPDPELIGEVIEFAKGAYNDRQRLSGENYIQHALRVALMLSQMGLDPETISAAILHDALDILPPSAKKLGLQEIEKKFGTKVANLVGRISELNKIQYTTAMELKEKKILSREKIENLRKMFLAMAGDLRVVLIEIASRMDGLEKLYLLAPQTQKLYALEIMQIFAPMADRLGLGEIKSTLEDKSFSYLFPERFSWLQSHIKTSQEEREKEIKKFIARLKKIFKTERVKFLEINYRAKSNWSTYKKLKRRNMDFEKIHDLVAVRIIAADIAECYKTLGIIHKYYKPLSDEINDYIAKPKPNGYRSLHTNIIFENEKITEIQIRTEQMHKEAEFGVCAHWSYKEKIDLQKEGQKFEWTKEVPEFWKTFKIDFFANQVFAFTPKGDIITLPRGSTPVDFAYAIHSDVGNHCESAKIGGKIVPLAQTLENGDVVEIITNKKRQPSQDWLKFVKTSFAKSNVKKATAAIGSVFKFPGYIKKKIFEISEKVIRKKEEKIKLSQEIKKHKEIYLAGQKGMLVNIAKCCNPTSDDKVKAYITKYRAAVLHKDDCENLQKLWEKFPNKIINAEWRES